MSLCARAPFWPRKYSLRAGVCRDKSEADKKSSINTSPSALPPPPPLPHSSRSRPCMNKGPTASPNPFPRPIRRACSMHKFLRIWANQIGGGGVCFSYYFILKWANSTAIPDIKYIKKKNQGSKINIEYRKQGI